MVRPLLALVVLALASSACSVSPDQPTFRDKAWSVESVTRAQVEAAVDGCLSPDAAVSARVAWSETSEWFADVTLSWTAEQVRAETAWCLMAALVNLGAVQDTDGDDGTSSGTGGTTSTG